MSGRRRSAPLVTVIAISYNHERFIRRCLDSVAAQTYPNVEIIVLDDHSTDGSLDVITRWIAETSTLVELIAHEQNQGICRNRNETLAMARGDYVACISTDDEWLPEKLEVQVEQMERLSDDVAAVYSDAYLIDESGAALAGMSIERNRPFSHPPEGDIFDELLVGNFIPALTTLVRRHCFLAVGGYDESLVYEDWDMWLRLSRRYQFAFTPQVTARYRITNTSLIHVLHDARRDEFFDSSLRLVAKHLDAGERARGLIRRRMEELAYGLGLLDHPAYLSFVARLDAFGDLLAGSQGIT
jgi:glycosyltransferase involved in cell wall biosynthesis